MKRLISHFLILSSALVQASALVALGPTDPVPSAPPVLASLTVGVLHVYGTSKVSDLYLENSTDNKQKLKFCAGPMESRMQKLVGMTVEVESYVSKDKNGGECSEPQKFKVINATSGRPAIVGSLLKENNEYVVKGDDDKRYPLSLVPASLQEHVGQKVIVDGKKVENKDLWLVASFMLFP